MILKEDRNKELFLESLQKHKERFQFKVYGMVIMDNHVHLIIEAGQFSNISKIMHAVLLSFSVKYRKQNKYTGYVWQGRFKSNLIEEDHYIFECLNYIHNNPVKAGMCESVDQYLWSSYHLYEGGALPDIMHKINLDYYGDSSIVNN